MTQVKSAKGSFMALADVPTGDTPLTLAVLKALSFTIVAAVGGLESMTPTKSAGHYDGIYEGDLPYEGAETKAEFGGTMADVPDDPGQKILNPVDATTGEKLLPSRKIILQGRTNGRIQYGEVAFLSVNSNTTGSITPSETVIAMQTTSKVFEEVLTEAEFKTLTDGLA